MNNLSVLLLRSPPFYTGAVACAAAPSSYTTVTLGGPRTKAQVREEIEALEKHLGMLRVELMNLEGT